MATEGKNVTDKTEEEAFLSELQEQALAPSTRDLYKNALKVCTDDGLEFPCTGFVLAQYLKDRKKKKTRRGKNGKTITVTTDEPPEVSTLESIVSAVRHYHEQHFPEHENPAKTRIVKTAMQAFRKRNKTEHKARPLTKEELVRLLDAIMTPPPDKITDEGYFINNLAQIQFQAISLRTRTWILVHVFSGSRIGELLNLRLSNIHFEDGGAVLNFKSSKGGQNQRAVLKRQKNPEFCPIVGLEQWIEYAKLQPQSFLFPGVEGYKLTLSQPVTTKTQNEILRDAAHRAKLHDPHRITTHTFRKTFAVIMNDSGASLADIVGALRHKNPATTQIYLEQHATTRLSKMNDFDVKREDDVAEEVKPEKKSFLQRLFGG